VEKFKALENLYGTFEENFPNSSICLVNQLVGYAFVKKLELLSALPLIKLLRK
jgi:hypothetical protein